MCVPVAHPACPLLFCCVFSREVRTDEGKKLAESWGAIFLESSAKESQVWGAEPTRGWERVPRVLLALMSPRPQVTMGIFMKLIEEIDRVDNSYGRSTSCRLM